MQSTSLWCAAALIALGGQAALADTQNFTVNAQYRGMVKKAFTNIGSGELKDTGSGPGGSFRLTGHAHVDHPREKGRVYDLRIEMAFRQRGSTIEEVSNRNRCNPGSEEALRTTEKMMPFVHVAKWISPDRGSGTSITTPRGKFQVRLGETQRNLEVTVSEGDRMTGKFFMEPDNGQLPRRMEKFRITTRGGTVLSFVTSPNLASR